jgi:hypothetical protein
MVQLFAVAAAGGACAFSLVALLVLPERFLLDHSHIDWVINSPLGSSDASASFRNIGTFYEVLGLGQRPQIAALLTLVSFTLTVFAAARWSEIARFGVLGLGVLSISFLCAAVYLSQYSKECIPLVLTAVLMVLPRSRFVEMAFLALALLYALWFRPYWAIIAAFYLVWRQLLRRPRRALTPVVVLVVLYLVLQVLFLTVLGTGLTESRDLVNDSRAGVDVSSLITDPFPSNIFTMVPNAVVLLAFLIVPVPLMLKFSVFHLLSGAMIAFLWTTALGQVLRRARALQGHQEDAVRAAYPEGRELRAARASALLIAVVSVQAIFEPDFGSYLKHLTPLMPLFLTLVPLRGTGPSPTEPSGLPILSAAQLERAHFSGGTHI